MTLTDLKRLIEQEVKLALGSTLEEPTENETPQQRQAELTEEELEEYLFYGERKKNKDDENPKIKFSV